MGQVVNHYCRGRVYVCVGAWVEDVLSLGTYRIGFHPINAGFDSSRTTLAVCFTSESDTIVVVIGTVDVAIGFYVGITKMVLREI